MISNHDILNTINELDLLYNSQPAQATYYSKLALLELCGWIETTMDYIVSEYSNVKLSEQSNIDHVNDEVIDKNYGFHYKKHFRPMLMKVIGIINLEKVESPLIISGDLSTLQSQLGSLYTSRNRAAHTHTGTTTTYDAPSSSRNYLNTLFPILQKIESSLQAI